MGNLLFGRSTYPEETASCCRCYKTVKPGTTHCLTCSTICEVCDFRYSTPGHTKCYKCRCASKAASDGIPGKLCYSCGTEKVKSQDALCNVCRIAGSFRGISLEDKRKKEEVQRVVPEQNIIEGRRYLGIFVCGKCSNSWQSANSWLGMFQKCKHCGTHVQPRQLKELIKRDIYVNDPMNRHPCELCQKCQQLGHYCRLSSNVKVETNKKRYGVE